MIETAQAFGIDIGGSGIKGAPVDLIHGKFADERLRIPTPEHSTPEAVAEVVKHFMANLDQSWVGVDLNAFMSEHTGRTVHVVNDADAAGLAEAQFGAAKNSEGLVIATTLGTGIGTALIINGVLVPNTELGHLELDGGDAEKYAADSVRSAKELTWKKWGKRLTKYYRLLEKYFSPDVFVVGGGVSKKHEKFFEYVDIETPIVPAALLNDAGIVGAAYFASTKQ